jgi:type II secretory pathway pseudopilin PulG
VRRAATLLELAVTMVVFGLVLALVARTAVFHERLQRRQRSAADGARASRLAVTIVARTLQGASPGDLVTTESSDSALDVMAPVGTGVACVAGRTLTFPAGDSADPPGLVLWKSYVRTGDRVLVARGLPTGAGWEARIVTAVQHPTAARCAGVAADLAIALDSAPVGGPLVAVRLSRRTRFNLYRGGDGAWYLGMRDWNAGTHRFNGVQPVTGPLRARSVRADRTGLHFAYLDSAGAVLALPLDSAATPAAIEIAARSSDSSATLVRRVVALRGTP